MAQVLLYNITDREKLLKLRLALLPLGIEGREVSPEDFGRPIAFLLGRPGAAETRSPSSGFSDEMLLMEGLSSAQLDRFLDALRQSGAGVALKAVVTDTNILWDSGRLHRELLREQQALARKKQSAHHKRK